MSEFRAPRIMGIINTTPDSFYAQSRSENQKSAIENGIRMIQDGVDILDIGGESSRPGSVGVAKDEQIRRVVPLIRGLRELSDITISIDTRSAGVAEAALDAGADIINDISALSEDPAMAVLAAERKVPVVLMHMKGTPATMQDNPEYENPVSEIGKNLLMYAEFALESGIRKENIILDPGIGFGKRLEDNTALIGRLNEWRPEDYQILIGLSRKSFLGQIIDGDIAEEKGSGPEDRLIATTAAHAWCLGMGVDILRVHDVKETRQLIAVWEAFSWAS